LLGMRAVWKTMPCNRPSEVYRCKRATSICVLGYVTGLSFLSTGISMFAVSRMAEKLAR